MFKSLFELFVGVRELDCANAFIGGCNQHAPKGRIGAGVANLCRYCAPPILVRRHAELRRSTLIQSAARAVSRVVHRTRNRMTGAQIALKLIHAAGIGIGFRRDP